MSVRACLALVAVLAACGPGEDTAGPGPDADTAGDTGGWEGPCPPAMVQVGGFCIDAFEVTVEGDLGYADQLIEYPDTATTGVATSVGGVLPTIPTSWYQARGACLNAGKHLCTVEEWQTACGEGRYPWGESPSPEEVCAIPAQDGTTAWTELQPTGSLPECRSPAGVFDQIGNAWEWADPGTLDDAGVPTTAKMGGAYYSGQGNAGCSVGYSTEHPPWFDGTIVARCCVEARE